MNIFCCGDRRKEILINLGLPPLTYCRKDHPGTELGEPGKLQGVNTGVVLLHLERMRTSPAMAHYLHPGVMAALCDKLQFKGFIGDQVWILLRFCSRA